MTPYQEKLATDFLIEAFTAIHNQVGDSTPLDSSDADLNEFIDSMTGNLIVPLHIPVGKTRAEYVSDLREALHLFFKEIPEMKYDEVLKNNIDIICDHVGGE